MLPSDGEKRSTCRDKTSPGLVGTSPGLVEFSPGLVVMRGVGVFIRVVTVYVKNVTIFNAQKASWLRRSNTEAGAVDFLRFSRPLRIVFGGGSLHDKRRERAVRREQEASPGAEDIPLLFMRGIVRRWKSAPVYSGGGHDACRFTGL
jgi:hypothetical protein